MAVRDYNVACRLKTGDFEISISDFSLSFAQGAIGSSLSCTLANTELEVTPTDLLLFELGIDGGGGMEWVAMLDVGQITEIKSNVEWVNDFHSITALSNLAAKWDHSPVRPIILLSTAGFAFPVYEGFTTPDSQNVTTDDSGLDDLVDEAHNPILPIRMSIAGLDLIQLLNFVYVTKLGFTNVVTNIPNYPIPRVDISIQDTFHGVASREIGAFDPEFHSDDGATLYILDPQQPLPPDLVMISCRPRNYVRFQRAKQTGRLINQIILSYRDNTDEAGSVTTHIENQPEIISGSGRSFQRIKTVQRFADFHDNLSNPAEVTRSFPFLTITDTYGSVKVGAGYIEGNIARETQNDLYKYDFRLKVGYIKEVSIAGTTKTGQPGGMQPAYQEVNTVNWEELASRPGEFIKKSELTVSHGTVIETDNGDGTFSYSTFYDNNKNGQLPDEDTTVLLNQAIETRISTFRQVGRDQIQETVSAITHLPESSSAKRNKSFDHTGTLIVRVRSQDHEVSMLLKNDGVAAADLRPPQSISAGNIPIGSAMALARRILARQGAAPVSVEFELAGLDLAMRRGSLRKLWDREGNTYKVFVTGFTIKGTNLGRPNFNISQSVQGIVIA